MPSDAPTPLDPPMLLLRKAKADLRLAESVVDSADADDEHIGFLAQQATEKAFKAVLSHRRIRFRFTHDLRELMNVLSAAGLTIPKELEAADALTPFAAQYRYDDFMELDGTARLFSSSRDACHRSPRRGLGSADRRPSGSPTRCLGVNERDLGHGTCRLITPRSAAKKAGSS